MTLYFTTLETTNKSGKWYQGHLAKKKKVFDFQKRNGKVDGGEMEGEDGGETRQDDKTKK